MPVRDTVFQGRTIDESLNRAADTLGPEERDVIVRAFAQATAIAARLEHSPQIYGLIHADFHRGNFLVAPGGAIAVIDFDDCGWGYYLADIAAATNTYGEKPEHAHLGATFLRGYRTVRPLSMEEERMLPAFYQLRRTFLLQWVIERTDNPALRDWLPQAIAKTAAGARTFLE